LGSFWQRAIMAASKFLGLIQGASPFGCLSNHDTDPRRIQCSIDGYVELPAHLDRSSSGVMVHCRRRLSTRPANSSSVHCLRLLHSVSGELWMAGRGVISEGGADFWTGDFWTGDFWTGIELSIRLRAAGTEMCLKSNARNATTQATMTNIAMSIVSNPAARLRMEGDLRASRSWISERVDLGTGGAS
jgi:hypothetical protein